MSTTPEEREAMRDKVRRALGDPLGQTHETFLLDALATIRRGLEAGEGETAEQIVERITALRRRDGDLLRDANVALGRRDMRLARLDAAARHLVEQIAEGRPHAIAASALSRLLGEP